MTTIVHEQVEFIAVFEQSAVRFELWRSMLAAFDAHSWLQVASILLRSWRGTGFGDGMSVEVRFLTEILEDFRRFVDEIWRFYTEFGAVGGAGQDGLGRAAGGVRAVRAGGAAAQVGVPQQSARQPQLDHDGVRSATLRLPLHSCSLPVGKAVLANLAEPAAGAVRWVQGCR